MRTVLFMILCSILFVMTRDKSVRYVMRTVLFNDSMFYIMR